MNNKLSAYLEKARYNLAKEGHFLSISDRELSVLLGLNPSAVNQWRKRNTYPEPETMMLIAYYGKQNIARALMDLQFWKSEGRAKEAYEIMGLFVSKHFAFKDDIITSWMHETMKENLEKLKKTAAAIFVIFVASSAVSPALAADPVSNPKSVTVYYDK